MYNVDMFLESVNTHLNIVSHNVSPGRGKEGNGVLFLSNRKGEKEREREREREGGGKRDSIGKYRTTESHFITTK